MTRIGGSICLVTGATGGIGRAVVHELRSRGGEVVASGRDRDALTALAASGAATVEADLASPEGPAELARRSLELRGRVDVLVNCAGVGWAGPLQDMEPADIARVIAVDLDAPVRLATLLLPGMIGRGRGHIVNVASIAGHTGVPHEAVYAATKAGLIAFSESLRLEVAGRGVAVTVVSPGVVATRFFDRRGRPYGRSFPRPIGPGRVARAVRDGIERDRAEIFVPGWLTLAARIRGGAPALYRILARRFG